jgi:AcrR family transcriptional regulator
VSGDLQENAAVRSPRSADGAARRPRVRRVTEAKPRGPYRTGIESRARIVSAAVEVFGRHGFRGGTLQQVADAVGLTPGAITKLFGSKEQLLIAVLYHWGELTTAVIGAEKRGLARLHSFAELMGYHVDHPGFLELYVTMAAEAGSFDEHPAHEFIAERYSSTLADLRRLFADGVHDGSFRPMTDAEIRSEAEWLLAAMDGLEIQFLVEPGFDLERSFRRYLDVLETRLAP